MPDMFADIANADPEMLTVFAKRLEHRAQLPGQQAMLADYLSRIDFSKPSTGTRDWIGNRAGLSGDQPVTRRCGGSRR